MAYPGYIPPTLVRFCRDMTQRYFYYANLHLPSRPVDVDYERYAAATMTISGESFRYVFCFKAGSTDKIYRFAEGSSLDPTTELGRFYYSVTLTLIDAPPQTDLGAFDVVADEAVTRFFFKTKSNRTMMYQMCTRDYSSTVSFSECYDNFDRLLCMKMGSTGTFYSGALSGPRFTFNQNAVGVTVVQNPPLGNLVVSKVSAWINPIKRPGAHFIWCDENVVGDIYALV
eukprot:IDg7643t1